MAFFWSWRWRRNELADYKGLGTADVEGDEKGSSGRRLLPSSNSTSSFSSASASNKHDDDYDERPLTHPASPPARVGILLAANILLFLTSVALFIALPYRRPSELNHAFRQVSTYSPILDDVEIPFVDKHVEGGLFPAETVEAQLLGRREPGPETDDLWLDYEIQRPFVLTREQVLALGKDPDMTVKYPDEVFGLGDEAYMGGMDAFHVLHCFNTIRKEAFKDYYWDGEKYHMEGYGEESPPIRRHAEVFWIHLRHCTDIIVQFLMCNADTTMTTMTWLETQERPWPDFSVNKKCIDFDALTRWRDENALDIAKAGMVRRPPGAQETKISDMYWKIMGNETHRGDNRHHPIWD